MLGAAPSNDFSGSQSAVCAPGLAPDLRAAHRLRPGELAHAFAGARWEVLAHEEGFDDDGRPAAGVVARRRAIT